MATLLFAIVMMMCGTTDAKAQEHNRVITRALIIDGDTIPHIRLPEVVSMAHRKHKTKRQQQKWTRFIYNVKKALPYARMLSQELKIIDDSLANISDPKMRKAYIDNKETEMFKKYEDQLKKLTVSQGRILIKLVDRETGHTSYEIIQLLKGKFKAFWWQGIARVFGSNLKTEYDPEGDDRALESVVLLIDLGVY